MQESATAGGKLHALAEFEGVIVGDDDLGALHVFDHVLRHDLPMGVVAVRVIRLENPQSVFDGETWGDNEETFGEIFAVWATDCVYCLPGNEHCHDSCFACASS